jgi:hypothetical protein
MERRSSKERMGEERGRQGKKRGRWPRGEKRPMEEEARTVGLDVRARVGGTYPHVNAVRERRTSYAAYDGLRGTIIEDLYVVEISKGKISLVFLFPLCILWCLWIACSYIII